MSVMVNRRPSWSQFAVWALCGATVAFVLLAAFAWGPLAMAPTLLLGGLALLFGGANISAVGTIAGIGAWGFVLAWLNRSGSPWPFAIVAVVLVGLAVTAFVLVKRRAG